MTPFHGPGFLVASGAGRLIQEPAPFQEPVVESPLPGGIAAAVRFLFNLPQGVQIVGAAAGLVLAVVILLVLWRRREAVVGWIASRSRAIKWAMGGGAAVLVLTAAGFGVGGWDYMQHDNGFCTGCHVMAGAFQAFTASEHDTLQCHDCHQQSMVASMRQLYLWVAERPQEIGAHSKVRNNVCERCHVTGQGEKWQRIASTAGHRTHLESDSLANLQCVTCHGIEVHHFAPVDSTCGQSGCHVNQEIALGDMVGQTALHCVTCHEYTADVPPLATRDSATGALVPGRAQCFSCHEMRQILADFDPARDPHTGTCGMCHNPHEQAAAAEAAATCASAQCHADWRSEPFHIGRAHRRIGERCTTCHEPHHASVDPSDCQGCHAAVRERTGQRLNPPLPFDTTRALRQPLSGATTPPPSVITVIGFGAPPAMPPGPGPATIAGRFVSTDTFPHDRHDTLACLTCHVTRTGHGGLTFQPPRGCQICHHQAPGRSSCAACHETEELAAPQPVTVGVTVADRGPLERSVSFDHTTHAGVRCIECHTTPVTLVPSAGAASCAACHEAHHDAARECAACHAGADLARGHPDPATAHRACDACHATATVARLLPDRSFCLTCHSDLRDHRLERECTVCHFLESPDAYRRHLLRAAGPGEPG